MREAEGEASKASHPREPEPSDQVIRALGRAVQGRWCHWPGTMARPGMECIGMRDGSASGGRHEGRGFQGTGEQSAQILTLSSQNGGGPCYCTVQGMRECQCHAQPEGGKVRPPAHLFLRSQEWRGALETAGWSGERLLPFFGLLDPRMGPETWHEVTELPGQRELWRDLNNKNRQ